MTPEFQTLDSEMRIVLRNGPLEGEVVEWTGSTDEQGFIQFAVQRDAPPDLGTCRYEPYEDRKEAIFVDTVWMGRFVEHIP